MPTKQKQSKKVSKADAALSKIRKLYAIEDNIKLLSPDDRHAQRQALSFPILKDLNSWLEKNISKLPKDSLTYTAMYYTVNQWESLTGYCEDGHVKISNVLAEKPQKVLSKSFLETEEVGSARQGQLNNTA